MNIKIDKQFLDDLLEKAKNSERLRMNFDLRTGSADNSQRMLNALLPKTQVPIHRHPMSSENVICLCGKLDEILYDDNGNELERIHLCPVDTNYGCQVPKGVWHTIEVIEPSVIYEAKDGKYGEDGSETYPTITKNKTDNFSNSFGDLKKNIEYFIYMERHNGSLEVITPLYVSRMLHVPLDVVEGEMRNMGLV